MKQFKIFMECKHSFQNKCFYWKKSLRFFLFLLMVILCSIGEVSQAAEIGYTKKDTGFFKDFYSLSIRGEIQEGDYLKFSQHIQSILKSGGIIYDVHLSSFGGNAVEAIQIGKRIRELCLTTKPDFHVFSDYNIDGQCKNIAEQCSSACFLIWAGGTRRSSGCIGIHRPYFPEKYFRGLSKIEADKKYNEMASEVYEYLKEMNIPTNLIDKMFETSSDKIVYLSQETSDSLFWVPFFEEWVTANCGSHNRMAMSHLSYIHNEMKLKRGERPPLTKEKQISHNKNKKMYHDYWNCYYKKLSEIQHSK
jgi:hypothetical protein